MGWAMPGRTFDIGPWPTLSLKSAHGRRGVASGLAQSRCLGLVPRRSPRRIPQPRLQRDDGLAIGRSYLRAAPNRCIAHEMGTNFKFAGETCVYCAKRPATTADPIFAPRFFAAAQRGHLPQVPACDQCGEDKSRLEADLAAALSFGAGNAEAPRLDKNSRPPRELSAAVSRSVAIGTSAVPIKPEKLSALFEMIAKGLVWRHWHIRPDRKTPVWGGILDAKGEEIFEQLLQGNARSRVDEDLDDGTLAYIGARGEDPSTSVWIFTIDGDVCLGGDRKAPHAMVSKIGVLIASQTIMRQFENWLHGGTLRRWLAALTGRRQTV
jgi:hypothetical protein